MRWLSLGVGYAHATVGGTEMYVHRLNLALRRRGVDATAAYFTDRPGRGTFEGVPLVGLPAPPRAASRMAHWACVPTGRDRFEALLAELRPDVVHFHGTLHVHPPEFFEAARAVGARTLWTYHAPGQTCLQTALLRNGAEPCDGLIEVERCTHCGLVWSGIPGPVATLFSRLDLSPLAPLVPARIRHPFERRVGTQLFRARFDRAASAVDLWVTHSQWCRDLLRRNGVGAERMVELPLPPPLFDELSADPSPWDGLPGDMRLLYAGRLLDIKGPHLLLEAMRGPLRSMSVSLVLLAPPIDSPYDALLRQQVAREPRARLLQPRDTRGLLTAMAAADAIVVPSVWLETGPYTAVEALWTGAAVVGSSRGGIPERLAGIPRTRTFLPGDVGELARAIELVARDSIEPASRTRAAASYREAYRAAFEASLGSLLALAAPRAESQALL
jgi:glycosyltransferase involved in cell wall biosynthesis